MLVLVPFVQFEKHEKHPWRSATHHICLALDEVLIKRFDKVLETSMEAQWITAGCAGCAANQFVSFKLNCSGISLIFQSAILPKTIP